MTWTLRIKAGCSPAIGVATVLIGRDDFLPGMTLEAPVLRALPRRITLFVGGFVGAIWGRPSADRAAT